MSRLIYNKYFIYLFIFVEKITGYIILKYNFRRRLKYSLDLNNPKSFNEKLTWKKLFDKNPLLPVVSDKLQVRDYVLNKLGEKKANEILIPLIAVYDSVEDIKLNLLPNSFVLKTNHGSGNNLIVREKSSISKEIIRRHCKDWLEESYSEYLKHEWCYKCDNKKILVEKMLHDADGKIPNDYKFHIIHGKCEMIECFYDRFHNGKRSLFDANWQLLDVKWQPWKWTHGGYVKKPDNLQEMINISEKLADEFDYIRVDLYNMNGKIYFGEMTNFPSSGAGDFEPQSFDFELGEKWNLQEKK